MLLIVVRCDAHRPLFSHTLSSANIKVSAEKAKGKIVRKLTLSMNTSLFYVWCDVNLWENTTVFTRVMLYKQHKRDLASRILKIL